VNSSKRIRPGRVRIVGGEYRGRRIALAAGADLRPTPDRVRETLFNWLGQRLDGAHCLDLYAGSGALGFEAASRGAARVVMVERDRAALAALRRAREELGAAAAEIVAGDAQAYLARGADTFDVVFLDPPFRQNADAARLGRVVPRLRPGARVVLEAPRAAALEPPWREHRRARAGMVSVQLLTWEPE
jgi:16S rRNA (guanine966-N2)-methyltransferase